MYYTYHHPKYAEEHYLTSLCPNFQNSLNLKKHITALLYAKK